MATKVGLIERMFKRTVVLKRLPNGKWLATDITNFPDDAPIIKAGKTILMLRPDRIFPVNGLKNIDRLCIQDPDSVELIDLSNKSMVSEGIPEKVIANMLDNAFNAGRLETEGTGGDEEKWKQQIKMILIIGILILLVQIGSIYMSRIGK